MATWTEREATITLNMSVGTTTLPDATRVSREWHFEVTEDTYGPGSVLHIPARLHRLPSSTPHSFKAKCETFAIIVLSLGTPPLAPMPTQNIMILGTFPKPALRKFYTTRRA